MKQRSTRVWVWVVTGIIAFACGWLLGIETPTDTEQPYVSYYDIRLVNHPQDVSVTFDVPVYRDRSLRMQYDMPIKVRTGEKLHWWTAHREFTYSVDYGSGELATYKGGENEPNTWVVDRDVGLIKIRSE